MKKIIGRALIVIPALFMQLLWYAILLSLLDKLLYGQLGAIINAVFSILSVIFAMSIIARRDESSYKLLWVMVITAMPVLGAILYFALGNKHTGAALKKKLDKTGRFVSKPDIIEKENNDNLSDIAENDARLSQTLRFISDSTGFPVLKNKTSKLYAFGEDMFADMCLDLVKAEKYVYIEYFIIRTGKFWDTLTDILAERIKSGVDVRVMYDDLGSIATYSMRDIKALTEKGIKCIPFNPFFLIKTQLNNRDHRKIMVIDGEIAYSGGVNLSDEYINEIHPHGIWKDIGFRITGAAVKSYAYMFMEFWNAFSPDAIPEDLAEQRITESILRDITESESTPGADNGYIMPYYDSPVSDEHTSNILYSEALSMATDYVWFYTPYLILGDALYDSFIRAARRGVDIRIIMPGIPDKKMVFRLSRSYYGDLIKAGVRIYEYTPGFVHAKAVLMDDKFAGIGSVNLDYRSLFLHFECNSIFYKADIVECLKNDYLNTLKACKEIKYENINRNIPNTLLNNFLRVFAPLL
ncbi:MAG: cardiolipin synthase [Lachnospiraceae bacterium]|nr:cardiolipin synthase [Lachnospiraceae bacterium]